MSNHAETLLTAADHAAQRRLNRTLTRMPRLGVLGVARRQFVRFVLRLGTLGADRRLVRRGLAVDEMRVDHAGHRLRLRRIARPDGPPPRVVILDIHGGAWAFGSARMDDKVNAALVDECDAIVLSLDYALALPRPISRLQGEAAAALDWALTASRDVVQQNLPVILTGESAGGHLSMSAAIACRDRGADLSRLAGMLLHYGAYDLGGSASARTAGPETLVLHGPTLPAQIQMLLPGLSETERRAPDLSPAYADLSALPPSLILVGDIDPLRDDNLLLAERLRAAGSPVECIVLPDCPHGVIHMPGTYAAKVRLMGHRWINARLHHAATSPCAAVA